MSDKVEKPAQDAVEKSDNLNRSMKPWQIGMIGVGGTIGTGLFLSSGYVMQNAGPGGTILAYLLGGLVMWLMMMIVGELTVEYPVAGGVQAYGSHLVNPSMGFTVGWMRWLAAAITVSAQLVASSIIIQNIFPGINTTLFVIGCIVLLFVMNMFSADKAGSSNFIFSSFKFFLIIAFIFVGIAMIFGIGSSDPTGFSNFTKEGGLFPVSFSSILMTMMAAIFAYGGADLSATAAGESENPAEDMPKAINYTIWGLIGSYLLSFIVLLAVLPWHSASLNSSPFADVFAMAGIPAAGTVVNVIVLTSALSSANAFIFASTRMLWSLGEYNQAPKFLSKLNKKKVPMNALIATMVFASLAVMSAFIAADTVYLFLQSVIGISNVFVYIIYAVCLFVFRKQYAAEGGLVEDLRYKTPLYPLTPIALIFFCVAIFVGMLFDPSQLAALYTGIPALIILYFGHRMITKKKIA